MALDVNWLTATDPTAATDLRVSFPTPSGDLNSGADLQTFKIVARKTAGSPDPTLTGYLYESGSQVGSALFTGTAITSATSQEIDATWNASALADASGAGVEFRIVSTPGTTLVTERLFPDEAFTTATNLTGAYTDVDDDPDSPDANWAIGSSNTANIVCTAGLSNPVNNVSAAANACEVRVQCRKHVGGTGIPTVTIDIYEGATIRRTAVVSGSSLSNETSQIFSALFTWDAAWNAANMRVRVTIAVGGTGSNRLTGDIGAIEVNALTDGTANVNTVEIGAINWIADYTSGMPGSVVSSVEAAITAQLAISASGQGIVQKVITASADLQAAINQAFSTDLDAEAALAAVMTAQATLESAIIGTITGAVAGEGVAEKGFAIAADLQAVASQAGTTSAAIEAVIEAMRTAEITSAEAVAEKTIAASANLQGAIETMLQASLSVEAAIKPPVLSMLLEALVEAVISETVSAEALVATAITAQFVAEAAISQLRTASTDVEALAAVLRSASTDGEAAISVAHALSTAAEGFISGGTKLDFLAEALILKGGLSLSLAAEAAMMAGAQQELDAEALIHLVSIGALDAEALINAAVTISAETEATIEQTISASASIHALIGDVTLELIASLDVEAAIRISQTMGISAAALMNARMATSLGAFAVIGQVVAGPGGRTASGASASRSPSLTAASRTARPQPAPRTLH